MENQGHELSSPGQSLGISELDHGSDDEVLLLQVEQPSRESFSPNLKAVIGKDERKDRPQIDRTVPLLLARPHSSGLDVSGFSFAKPAPRGKPLLLQQSARQSLSAQSSTLSQGQSGISKPRGTIEGSIHTNSAHSKCDDEPDNYLTRYQTEHNHASTGSFTPEINPPQNLKTGTSRINSASSSKQQHVQVARGDAPELESNRQQVSAEQVKITSATTQPKNDNVPKESSMMEVQIEQSEATNENHTFRPRPVGPMSDEYRVSKRRATHAKASSSVKQPVTRGSNEKGSQLSEEDLFELLIHRMRDREENELVASSIQKQMQAHILEIAEENEVLKNHVGILETQVEKGRSQIKTHRAQIESWKKKLGKFKGILNELGAEYQNLRKENLSFKELKESLDQDEKEIKSEIESARQQVAQAIDIVSEKKSHISKTENMMTSMTLALESAEERTKYIEDQLSKEKRRSTVLESYIQNSSHVQTRQLGLIRTDQLEMNSKIQIASEILSQKLDTTWMKTSSMLRSALEDWALQFKEVKVELSKDKADVQQCNEIANKLALCMETFGLQLKNAIERSCELNEKMACNVNSQLKLAEGSENHESGLLNQLNVSQKQYGDLKRKLEELEPSIYKFSYTVQHLEGREDYLAQKIDQLDNIISEARTLNRPALPATEISDMLAENSALKSQIQHLSDELSSMEGTITTKELEKEQMKGTLREVEERLQKAEKRAVNLETDVVASKQRMKLIESEVREELNRASVISRDQIRAKFEQQVHGLLREKAEVEKEMNRYEQMLSEAERSMVESADAARKRQDELEASLVTRERHIQNVEESRVQDSVRLNEQKEEIMALQQSEASATVKHSSLAQQLDEARKKIIELDSALSVRDIEVENQQRKLHSLQDDLSKKEKECSQIEKDLENVQLAKLSLEEGKSKAKSEIHALLKRLQDSEHWMKGIKEAIGRLSGSSGSSGSSAEGLPVNTWSGLQSYLGLPDLNGPSPGEINGLEKALAAGDDDISNRIKTTSTPTKICETPVRGLVQRTEFIYRTHSIQSGPLSSPSQHQATLEASNSTSRPADLKLSNEIIPFSSIRQQASPALGSSLSPEPSDLADMLIFTPQNQSAGSHPVIVETPKQADREINIPSSPKDPHVWTNNQNSQKIQQEPMTMETTTNCANTGTQKTVTFEADDQEIGGEKRKFSTVSGSQSGNSTFERQAIDRPEHTARRTYSKHQRYASKGVKNSNPTNISSVGEIQNKDNHSDNQYTSNDKRPRVSMASSYSRTGKQAQDASEYVERRGSPTSLASGSSRQPSANGNHRKNNRWTRSAKRGGRKTRSDRYDARFSQEIS